MVCINGLLTNASKATYIHIPENSRLISRHTTRQYPYSNAVIFLDRDGVIIEDVNFLRTPQQIRLLRGACQALRVLQNWFYLIIVTNQSGIARGILSEQDLLEIHSELVKLLASEQIILDAIYYCPHLPDGSVPDYSTVCNCRKPLPGMLLQASNDWGIDIAGSFIIGDSLRDLQAGKSIGVPGILIGDCKTKTIKDDSPKASNLLDAVDYIMNYAKIYYRTGKDIKEYNHE